MPKASIIIRTLNEEKHLPQLFDRIAAQDLSGPRPELILVDSGSTDRTVQIAAGHGCRILNIRREEFSFGRSLNVGCDASDGEHLVFVSGHCVPTDDRWLANLCQPLEQGAAVYVYGRQIGGAGTQFSERQIFAKYFPGRSRIPQEGFYCNNANAAMLRSTWLSHPFDEDLTGLEDMHLAKRLVGEGLRIAYTAEACVYHLHDESWSQVRRRFEREARALQQIMPQVHIRQRDVVRYLVSSIKVDMQKALADRVLTRNIGNIVRYRFHQYMGSYLGNRAHQELSHEEKDRYFYPDQERLDQKYPSHAPLEVSDRVRAAASSDD